MYNCRILTWEETASVYDSYMKHDFPSDELKPLSMIKKSLDKDEYFCYGISAQLKAIVDRLHTPMRNTFHIRKLGLLLVGAAQLPNLFEPIIMQYQMVLDFFKLESIGTVLVRGAKDIGDIEGHTALEKAYELGVSLK